MKNKAIKLEHEISVLETAADEVFINKFIVTQFKQPLLKSVRAYEQL